MTERGRKLPVSLMAIGFIVTMSGAVHAHGLLESSDPKPDARLNEVPGHIYVNLTEPPTDASTLKVVDGCGRDVIDTQEVVERTLHATLVSSGQPGRWKVSFSAISATDGHETKDGYNFLVNGDKDCSEEAAQATDAPAHDAEDHGEAGDAGAEGELTADEGEGDDGGFPIVPVALGVVVLGALAFGIRAMSHR